LTSRCPSPTGQCKSYLSRFSCLQNFLECDAQGFQVTQCAGTCISAENVCGPWYSLNIDDCSQKYPDYVCDSSRYLTAEPCTGDVTITPSAGGYNFGIIGSIQSPAPPSGSTGGGFNNQFPSTSPGPIPLTPDQTEPEPGYSPSRDCPSATPSPGGRSTTISTGNLPSPTGAPPRPSSSSQLSLSLVVLAVIFSMLWLAF
jgi:hypothetical protein